MNSRINILNELRGISPALASLPFTQPYRDVPEGYFEGLMDDLLLKVRDEQKSDILPVADKVAPYQVPEYYFQQLPAIIMQRIKAAEEENSNKEIEILSPLLGGLKKKNTYQVPQGYFDDLSGNAISGAKAIEFVNVELENLSPLMMSLKEKQLFTTPVGYFEDFPAAMLAKARESITPAKVISMGNTRRIMRFAVAAAVIGFIAVSTWFYTKQPALTSFKAPELHQFTEAELQGFVESESVIVAEPFTVSSEVLTEEDIKDLFADISDEDLQKYIDQESGVKRTHTN